MKPSHTRSKNCFAGILAALLALLSITAAHAQIFVANDGSGVVGEYNLNGTTINAALIPGLQLPSDVVLSGGDLFVTNSYIGTVGEYTTSGATVNASLISGLGVGNPYTMALSGNTLYVSEGTGIATYSTSGSLINSSFITGLAGAGAMAISGNDLFVENDTDGDYSKVEEFNATTGALINGSLITNLDDTDGLAVSGNDIYTASYGNGTVSEFTTSGAVVNATLVSGLGDAGAEDVAVAGNDLYVTDDSTNAVGEYNATTGAVINATLINSINYDPTGLAIIPLQSWNGGSSTDANWSDVNNWAGGIVPGAAGTTNNGNVATFNTPIANTWGNSSANPIVIDSAYGGGLNIAGINFDTASANYFIGSTGGNPLLLTSGGVIQILSTLTSTNAVETINAPIVLEGTANFANNSANGTGAGAGTLDFNGGITAANPGTDLILSGSNTNPNTISGVIADGTAGPGGMSVTESGPGGTWVLAGANTYTGATSVTAGTLNLTGSLSGSSVTTSGSGVFTESATGGISGSGTFTQGSSGHSTLDGANNYTGATTVSAGTLQIGNGTSGSISSSNSIVASGATLAFDQANGGAYSAMIDDNGSVSAIQVGGTTTLSGIISGSGDFTQSGAGTTILTGVNTYSGGTDITSGTLTLSGSGTLGATTGALVVDGGTLGLGATNQTVGTLNLAGGTITGTTGTLTGTSYTSTGANTVSAILAGTGGFTNTSGTTTLSSANTYTGATTVSGGTLQIGNGTSGSISGSNSTVASGATLAFDEANGVAYSGTISDSGAVSAIQVGANTTLGGIISGSGGFKQSGTGTTTLTGANTFSGGTTISGGTLTLSGSGTLGATTGALAVDSGGTLSFGATNQTVGTVNLAGGTISSTTGTLTGTSYTSTGGTVSAILAGTSGFTNTSGTTTLSGANTYTGTTTVSGGTLQLNSGGVINGGAVDVGNGTKLIVNGGSLTSNALSDITVLGVSGTADELLVENGATATFNGGLQTDPGGNTNWLISVTGGTLAASSLSLGRSATNFSSQALAETNSTTEGLVINGGAVNITGALDMGNQTAGVNSSVNLRLESGSLTVGGTTTITDATNGRYSIIDVTGGTFTSNDTTGAGIKIGGFDAATTDELYVNGGTVDTNTITLGDSTQTSGTDILHLNGIATGALYVGTGGIVNGGTSATTTITLSGGILGALGNWSSSLNMTLNNATIQTGNASGTPFNISLSGVLSGTTLTELGTGTLTLTNTDTYTGLTMIVANTLQLGDGTSGHDGTIESTTAISNNGNLIFDRYGTVTSSVQITGDGNVTISGPGMQILTGYDHWLGTTTINAGATLQLGDGTNNHPDSDPTDSTSGIVNNGALIFDRYDNDTANESISGPGSVTIIGPGKQQLLGNNTYSGGTTVNGSTLVIEASSGLGSGNLTMEGGTLQVGGISFATSKTIMLQSGNNTFTTELDDTNGTKPTFNGIITGSGALTLGNTLLVPNSVVVLTAGNTYTGLTTITAGSTLQLGDGTSGHDGTINSTSGLIDDGFLSYDRYAAQSSSQVISGTGEVLVTGSGSQTLTGNNTYSGGTTVAQGTLVISGINALGGANFGGLILFDGTLQYATNLTSSSDLSVGIFEDNGTIDTNGHNIAYVNSIIYNASTGAEDNLTIEDSVGTGSLTLDGVNTFTGYAIINPGATLQLGDGTSGHDGTINGSYGITNNGSLIFDRFDASGSLNYTHAITGTGSVTKAGSGTQVLSGTNTYTGGTTISAGTLLANSSNSTGSGAVTVSSGGTLGGTGTINTSGVTSGNAITVASGGILNQTAASGGLGTSTLTLALQTGTTVNLNSGATLAFDLGASGISDQMYITGGTLTLNSQSFSSFTFTTLGTFTGSGTYDLIVTSASGDIIIGSALGTLTGMIGASNATLSLSANTSGTQPGSQYVVLTVTAPEPSTYALLLVGLGLLAVYLLRTRQTPA